MTITTRTPCFNSFVAIFVVLTTLLTGACSSGGGGDDDDTPAGKAETLSGTVTDMASTNAIEGVIVTAIDGNNNSKSTTTDSNGTYTIDLTTNTNYRIVFNSYLYSIHTETDVQLTEGASNTLDAALTVAQLGTVTGQVKDAANQATLLANVTVTIIDEYGTNRGTVNTQGDGTFSIELPEGHPVILLFELANYISTNYNGVVANSALLTSLNPIFLVDTGRAGSGGLSGNIVDATTGDPIANATVNFREGINSVSGSVLVSVITDIAGNYTVNQVLSAGIYTCEIILNGYIVTYTTIFVFGGEIRPDQNTSISPELASGQIRIVLSWGAFPEDLDAHLTGPTSDNAADPRFHVYWIDKSTSEVPPKVVLDLDDQDGEGPETITIHQQHNGVYRYSVHDYDNSAEPASTALANSGARVELFRNGFPTETFFVPGGIGTLWTVFELDGNTLTPINSMTNHDSSSTIQSVTSNSDASLFKNLPAKQ